MKKTGVGFAKEDGLDTLAQPEKTDFVNEKVAILSASVQILGSMVSLLSPAVVSFLRRISLLNENFAGCIKVKKRLFPVSKADEKV